VMGIEIAWDHAQTFVSAAFSGAERHRRNLPNVAHFERRFDERVTFSPRFTTHSWGTLKPPRRIPRGPRWVRIIRPTVRPDIFSISVGVTEAIKHAGAAA
jgi:hypothetical protein